MVAFIIIMFVLIWTVPIVTVGYTDDQINMFGEIWTWFPFILVAVGLLISFMVFVWKKI